MHCLKCEIILRCTGVNSLKEKRSILKKIIFRIKENYNVAIIESDCNDSREFITIGVSALSDSRDFLYDLSKKIEEYIEDTFQILVVSEDVEIF